MQPSLQFMETLPYKYNLFGDVHLHLPNPTEYGRSFLVKGPYTYFHYGCDGYNDVVTTVYNRRWQYAA